MTNRWSDAEAPACIWCGAASAFSKAGTSTGFKITAWCAPCQKPATTRLAYPKGDFGSEQIEAMPWVESSPLGQCGVCKKAAHTERHHLAPRGQFGDECELWPTVDVCRPCHERWHALMGQPINVREAAE